MPSGRESLQNLQKIGKLKAEAPAQAEINGLIRSAENKLRDAENPTNSAPERPAS